MKLDNFSYFWVMKKGSDETICMTTSFEKAQMITSMLPFETIIRKS
jgi:hypothetical protein